MVNELQQYIKNFDLFTNYVNEIDTIKNIDLKIKKIDDLIIFLYEKIVYNKILYLVDILNKKDYFYDFDRKWIESVIFMIWNLWKLDEEEVADYINNILKTEIKTIDIYKTDENTVKKINSWEWWIIWVMKPNSKYSIWRWLNLQNFKNLFLLYIDSYDAEELNQALWRTDRITKNIWKRNHLLYRLDNYNIEIWNFIEKIKKWWKFYAWESKILEIKQLFNKIEGKDISNLDKEIKIKISWDELLNSQIIIWEKITWIIELLKKLDWIIIKDNKYWKEILWWLFSNTNLLKSIL